MSTRAILNKTSRKKRNGMLSFSNTTTAGTPAPIAQNPLTIIGANNGNLVGLVHFRPTSMDLASPSGAANTVSLTGQRTATTCFMRGLAENIRIETSSGAPWFHRRICLTSRASLFRDIAPGDTSGIERANIASGSIEATNGWQRLAANAINEGAALAATRNVWYSEIFKGSQGADWDDYITAPIDTNRIDVKFDKTWIYRSGNESGILKEKKLWHPMNRNLYYNDDENGAGLNTIDHSVNDKRGMGDYHIFDFFSQGSSGGTGDLLKIRYTSTLYWHEK